MMWGKSDMMGVAQALSELRPDYGKYDASIYLPQRYEQWKQTVQKFAYLCWTMSGTGPDGEKVWDMIREDWYNLIEKGRP